MSTTIVALVASIRHIWYVTTIWLLSIISTIQMDILASQILIGLVPTISLWWQWDVVTLVTLDCLRESSWTAWNLRLTRNVVLMLHHLLVHILPTSIRVLFRHIILSVVLIWLVAPLLLRGSHSWNRPYVSLAWVCTILLVIYWWHSLHHCSSILSIIGHLGILIALGIVLAIDLIGLAFANLPHWILGLGWTFLVVWLRVVHLILVSLHVVSNRYNLYSKKLLICFEIIYFYNIRRNL